MTSRFGRVVVDLRATDSMRDKVTRFKCGSVGRRSAATADRLRAIAGMLLCVALVFAPWCWGCAWPSGIRALNFILLPAAACGLGAALLKRDRTPAILLTMVALILIQGWGMALNARSIFAETTGLFAPLDPPLSGWPGSIERNLSLDTMARVTALLGAMLVAASLGRDRAWRRRFALAMIATAVSIVLLGCAEYGSGAHDIFWGRTRHLDYFFASYRNVTNAGEYLNIAAPLAMAAAWIARSPDHRAAAVCALAIIVVGVCVCGSKAAPILFAGLAAVFLAAKRDELARSWMNSAQGLLVVGAVAGAMALMVWGAGVRVAQDRWDRFLAPSGAVTVMDRLRVDRICLDACRDETLFGAGPGTFPVLFARLQSQSPDAPPGRWLAAHNDYLQAELEWGAPGVALGAGLIIGAILQFVVGLRRASWRAEDRAWSLGFLLALSGTAIMALVDFPMQMASIELQIAVLTGLGWSSFAWPRARCKTP